MPSLSSAIERARGVLAVNDVTSVEKTIFASPAGKKRLAKRLAAMLPKHDIYIEPFAGSAAVLFEKEPSRVEVINDADPEIAEAYRILKRLTPKDVARLSKKSWRGDKATFMRMVESQPKSDIEKLYRFLYVSNFSYGKMRGKSFSPSVQGVEARTPKRLEKFLPRLKKVHVYSGDYERVVRKYDAKNAVLFLDPPYAGYDVDVGEKKFDEQRFFKLLKELKGKFLITYGIRGELPKLVKQAGFVVKQIRVPRTIASMRGVGGPSVLTQLVISNYTPTKKSLEAGDGLELLDVSGAELDAWCTPKAFAKQARLIKNADPSDERYVLGVVLEPEVVDAQGDIYSAEEIRLAAHDFMENFQGLGLQHRERVNGDVRILESYILPDDSEVGGVVLKKGTWLLGLRVVSDELWQMVKDGDLTGLSIGGSARKVPVEPSAA
jgi:DNA adenine methylase